MVFFQFQEFWPNSDRNSSFGSVPRRPNLSTQAKGAVAVYAHEIATHQADIAKNDHAMKGLTKVREEENREYQEEKEYMETTLTALHQAIEVLNGAGTKKVMGTLKIAAKVREAILDSPKLDAMSEKQSKLLKNFLENPVVFLVGQLHLNLIFFLYSTCKFADM